MSAPFTSDLSVADFALCDQLGLEPLAQVMGSSIYQVGYESSPWSPALGGGFVFEMEALSQAWNEVRDRALGRLAEEATRAGADAVIGVDVRTGAHDFAEGAIEQMVIGTAVRHTRDHERPAAPVLTELSVADYAKLLTARVEPLGIVAWSSVFFVGASYSTQMMSGIGSLGFTQNQELPEFTQGIYSAREIAVGRLTEQAVRLDASGVIGTRIAHNIRQVSFGAGAYSRGGLMVTFHAIGTAIRESGDAAETRIHPPETTIDLTI